MTKNISLQPSSNLHLHQFRQVIRQAVETAKAPFNALRRYYGAVLGKEISARQTWLLLKVQAAFVLAGFPMESPVLLRLACVAWFVQTLLACRRSLA